MGKKQVITRDELLAAGALVLRPLKKIPRPKKTEQRQLSLQFDDQPVDQTPDDEEEDPDEVDSEEEDSEEDETSDEA